MRPVRGSVVVEWDRSIQNRRERGVDDCVTLPWLYRLKMLKWELQLQLTT